jgi:hypothetical protein
MSIRDYLDEKRKGRTIRYPQALFHGSDAKIIRMTEDERLSYFADCKKAIDYLWPFYEKLMKEDFCFFKLKEKKGEEYGDLISLAYSDALAIQGYKRGHGQYEYGAFYLAYYNKACHYAERAYAGGEFARFTHTLITAADVIGFDNWQPDANTRKCFEKVIKMANAPKEPVVFRFAFEDLDIDYLRDERGERIDWFHAIDSFRYLKPLTLELSKAERPTPSAATSII